MENILSILVAVVSGAEVVASGVASGIFVVSTTGLFFVPGSDK